MAFTQIIAPSFIDLSEYASNIGLFSNISMIASDMDDTLERADLNFEEIKDFANVTNSNFELVADEIIELQNAIGYVESAMLTLGNIQSQVTTNSDDIANIQSTLANVPTYAGNLVANITALQNFDNVLLSNTLPYIDGLITGIQDDLATTNITVGNLSTEINALGTSITSIENNITVIEGSITNVENSIVTVNEDITDIKYQMLTILSEIPVYRVSDIVNNMHKNLNVSTLTKNNIMHAYIQGLESLRLAYVNYGMDMPMWIDILHLLFNKQPSTLAFDVRMEQIYDLLNNPGMDPLQQAEMRKAYVALYNNFARIIFETAPIGTATTTHPITGEVLPVLYQQVSENYALTIDEATTSSGFIDTTIRNAFNAYYNTLNNVTACYDSIYKIMKNNPFTPLTARTHVTNPWAPL